MKINHFSLRYSLTTQSVRLDKFEQDRIKMQNPSKQWLDLTPVGGRHIYEK